MIGAQLHCGPTRAPGKEELGVCCSTLRFQKEPHRIAAVPLSRKLPVANPGPRVRLMRGSLLEPGRTTVSFHHATTEAEASGTGEGAWKNGLTPLRTTWQRPPRGTAGWGQTPEVSSEEHLRRSWEGGRLPLPACCAQGGVGAVVSQADPGAPTLQAVPVGQNGKAGAHVVPCGWCFLPTPSSSS